ncbi:hypothetical protein [Endozoicomonas sp. GU-1]|uniref:AbrB/MazE/SpoVT family DNA-binding domain-containing protein n=1 Tax=Endozoicomonas sp. GU-1 TaxID=3009078 RepID=UPI0022B2ED04|nr:hypothetical protein [Endozoicomonas sp. GU-1]WBA83220.1 hypothetical protein O2T12_08930 [Endozoicomonas sp. GU-1]WBA86145.1 hypothetical protein O3276_23560 [Endozoicomonas sp. GU-1]
MRTESTIKRWGNGLALWISGPMRDIPGFEEGMGVEVEIHADGLFIRRKVPAEPLPYSEEELVASLQETLADNNVSDWLEDTLPREEDF